ncbi:ribose-phosphate diphosphokinase [uncultured Microscilla sp.]|uniref:ribose-phosphate diphosphokinase n=1 Tax=uncultured Microscilla sp. TaxID=432653 RepID=UPI0026327A05|nr:ribose-phosphate diphosphokinase [uncultured Microscilla sp.]
MKIIFSTQNYAYLKTKLLALDSSYEDGATEVRFFPDGERYQRILSDVNGKDVVIVGGTIADSDTLELFDMACAIEKYGGKTLTLVIPYFGYSTMERAVKPGEVVTGKSRARLLSAIPITGRGNQVLLFDLHTSGLQHYFEGNIRPVHIYCKDLVIEAARELGGEDFILACTDTGRAKWVESLANDMGIFAAFVFKRRISAENTQITGINADVKGKNVVIYDDMIRTGGSLINAAQAYKDAGATKISAITTHGIFPNNAMERLQKSGLFECVVSTDSHPNAVKVESPLLKIKSIDRLIIDKLEGTIA